MEINIDNRQSMMQIPDNLITHIKNCVELCLKQGIEAAECEVTIILAGIQTIKELNMKHMGREGATDVLSFPIVAKDNTGLSPAHGDTDMDTGLIQLGDVVVCPEVACSQALENSHSFERELLYLIAHGVLHLMGYDHADGSTEMFERQQKVLDLLGIS